MDESKMNERIKQLAIEANLIHAEQSDISICYEGWNYSTDNLEKFAELIIYECAGIANAGIDPTEDYLIGNDILKEFGINDDESTNQEMILTSVKEFSQMVKGKENLVGRPVYFSQWPNKDIYDELRKNNE